MTDWIVTEGASTPLGATWVESARAWNFAIYSKHAEAVTLLLYTEADLFHPSLTYRLDHLRNKSGRIWHCRISEADSGGARYYAYSIAGPKPQTGFDWHSFDAEKILLDPYAKAVFFPPGFDRVAASRPGSNAGMAPLGLLTSSGRTCPSCGRGECEVPRIAVPSAQEGPNWSQERRKLHQTDTVIYELHVRGFTNNPNSGVRPENRGTYAGVIDKIPYLKDLGVTAVELMPVFQFDPQEGSYWGYMPLNFFAPHHSYACCGCNVCDQHIEFRSMVEALHAAGIEVVLDVVYNHTAEGDQNGPIYSFKGIDSSTYYLMSADPRNPYVNFSGTGNTLHCTNPYVRKMIVDSLRYWAKDMHVDGFRFDLASVFSRNDDGSLNNEDPPIFGEIADLEDVRHIAEPWDAAGAYQLGRNFPGMCWFQWNGRFRDDIRRFVRGEAGLVAALMQRLYGSDDLFPDDLMNAFHPYQSVNFITSHDGFTLYDLVSHNQKHNWANGHCNTDGTDENYSWNCGWEGDDQLPPEVLALRKRQTKNFCCLLFIANGTPMLRAGDEFLHTQGGNNNPYNQDNATSWLDWDRLRTNQDVFRFFRAMIRFRKAHPSLGRSRFWRDDVRWFGTGPTLDLGPASQTLAVYLCGASQQDLDLYLMINGSQSDETFLIQVGSVSDWKLVFDTSQISPDDFPELSNRPDVTSLSYVVRAHSIVGLVRDRAKESCQ